MNHAGTRSVHGRIPAPQVPRGRDACPYCGVVQRLGVYMTPKRAEIFDKVKRAGRDGLHWRDSGVAYPMHLRVLVHHVNEALEETDWGIRCHRAGMWTTYVLEKVR